MLQQFTEADFKTAVLGAEKPVLVKFWSEGCYPCKMLTPIAEQFAEKYADQVIVGEVNAAQNMQLAIKYSVSAVPTTILFKGGQAIGKILGYVDLEDLEERVLPHLEERQE